jgi:2-polyprenyl-3-methyl-5-hydroxy-6-metoxy-1,4-benzoquinol methylase
VIGDAYFDRFQTKKYRAKNPLKRALIRRFAGKLHALFEAAGPVKSVLEIGVGEGFLSGFLAEHHPEAKFSGVDLNATDLELLKQKFSSIETYCADVYDLSRVPKGFDLVICAEVLEHLHEPRRALQQIKARQPRSVIFTVPHEPWFMLSNLAMGKNVSRFGNDIEHVNHFGPRSFRELLSSEFELERETKSYPWLLALARPR